jgi:hypothetical protein
VERAKNEAFPNGASSSINAGGNASINGSTHSNSGKGGQMPSFEPSPPRAHVGRFDGAQGSSERSQERPSPRGGGQGRGGATERGWDTDGVGEGGYTPFNEV